jgi:hypothetical protein
VSDLHPFEPFSNDDGRCTECGEPEAEHRTDLRQYRVGWRAVVEGQTEVWASSIPEARQQFYSLSESAMHYEIDEYDFVIGTAAGRWMRVLGIKLSRKAGAAP